MMLSQASALSEASSTRCCSSRSRGLSAEPPRHNRPCPRKSNAGLALLRRAHGVLIPRSVHWGLSSSGSGSACLERTQPERVNYASLPSGAPIRAAVTPGAAELGYRRPGDARRSLFAEPSLFSRLKIVWGSFGTEPGAGTLLGFGGVGGLSRRGEAMLTRLAQRRPRDQPSQLRRRPASGPETTPNAGRPLR